MKSIDDEDAMDVRYEGPTIEEGDITMDTSYERQRMEDDQRDRFERSKTIGAWINETLRYSPYSHSVAPPTSKHSRSSTFTPLSYLDHKLPSISVMLARTSLQTSSNNTIPYLSGLPLKASRATIHHISLTPHLSTNLKPASSHRNERIAETHRFNLGSPTQFTSPSLCRTPASLGTDNSHFNTMRSSSSLPSRGESESSPPLPPRYTRMDGFQLKQFEARLIRRSE